MQPVQMGSLAPLALEPDLHDTHGALVALAGQQMLAKNAERSLQPAHCGQANATAAPRTLLSMMPVCGYDGVYCRIFLPAAQVPAARDRAFLSQPC